MSTRRRAQARGKRDASARELIIGRDRALHQHLPYFSFSSIYGFFRLKSAEIGRKGKAETMVKRLILFSNILHSDLIIYEQFISICLDLVQRS